MNHYCGFLSAIINNSPKYKVEKYNYVNVKMSAKVYYNNYVAAYIANMQRNNYVPCIYIALYCTYNKGS